jgi:hypothetical protein
MAMPSAWVDHLFAKLVTRYGAAFMRQYQDLDPRLVKADWAEVLDGVTGDAVLHALKHLPPDRPPNVMQFRELCVIPVGHAPALPAPARHADEPIPPEVAAQLVRLKSSAAESHGATPAERAYRNVMAAVERNDGRMSAGQRDFLAAMRASGRLRRVEAEQHAEGGEA